MVDTYVEESGLADPTPLLHTPWMSEEVSDFSESDPDIRAHLVRKKAAAANLSEANLAAGVKVLEVLRPEWRSTAVSIFYLIVKIACTHGDGVGNPNLPRPR